MSGNPFETNTNRMNEPFDAPLPPPIAPPVPKKQTDPRIMQAIADLRKREDELNRREGVLDQRETILMDRSKKFGRPPNNWPGKPWPFRKLLYQDIKEEIPTEHLQTTVTHAYRLWKYGLWWCLTWNLLNQAAQIHLDAKYVGNFIVALIYFLFYAWISFWVFRILYNGAKDCKASGFVVWMILAGLSIAISVIWCLGLPGVGTGGIVNAIEAWTSGKSGSAVVGILMFIGFGFWVCYTVALVYVFLRVVREFRNRGGLRAAKTEARERAFQAAYENPDLVAAAAQQGARTAAANPGMVAQQIQQNQKSEAGEEGEFV